MSWWAWVLVGLFGGPLLLVLMMIGYWAAWKTRHACRECWHAKTEHSSVWIAPGVPRVPECWGEGYNPDTGRPICQCQTIHKEE